MDVNQISAVSKFYVLESENALKIRMDAANVLPGALCEKASRQSSIITM